MIPLIAGTIGVMTVGFGALTYGASAGMGYGLGRKWGRKVCEMTDSLESRVKNVLFNNTSTILEE